MKKSFFSFAFAVCMLGALTANAQDHTFSAGMASGLSGGSVSLSVTYDNANAGPEITQGYNYGLCTADETIAVATAHVAGADGAGAFTAYNVVAGGVTAGVILSFDAMVVLGPGTVGAELSVATYDILAEGTTALDFCGTLGSPPVPLGVGLTDTSLPQPTVNLNSGSVTGQAAPPPFIFNAPTSTVAYDGNTGTGSTTLNFSVGENPANALGQPTSGFSMAVSHDPALLTANVPDIGPLTAAMGAAPAFSGPGVVANGWTIGVIYDFGAMLTPDLTAGLVAVVGVTYDITAPVAPAPDSVSALVFETLGSPPVPNDITIGTDGQMIDFQNGQVTLTPLVDLSFIRGDCNQDLIVNIADGIFTLNALFQSGPSGGCAEACDANDDGMFDSSDAIYTFNYQFLGGPAPAAPFPSCGTEAGADCASSPCP